MEPLTLFTWGYWGWGNATDRLVEAVDAVESARGFNAPKFVDIRLRHTGRAAGFQGDAFEKTVGVARHESMPGLGNKGIVGGGAMEIADESKAADLLNLAIKSTAKNQRVLFFCACEYPGAKGLSKRCHRSLVAELVLKEARRRKKAVHIIEWPGGEPDPKGVVVELAAEQFKKVTPSARTIPLGQPDSLAQVAGLPWGSIVSIRERGSGAARPFVAITEPVKYARNGWVLPVVEMQDSVTALEEAYRRSQFWRAQRGVNLRGT